MITFRQFAENILFSPNLEAKLAPPPSALVDEHRHGEIVAPLTPHRPADLQFSPIGARGPRLREDRLGEERERGILLHFFCNHELLATELMALALVKFPDAPIEFRRGLMRTLREEQQHTQWYLQRMKQCGVTFGEYPVNGFFWRSIANMQTPMDYVARLSLTFEQANLDYAQHYAQRFAQAGDSETSALLSQIYKDEIAHVGYGLKWFRRWKDKERSDWEAFHQMLPFPLSPARAKGTVAFNAEGRRKAGLENEFISALDLFSQSRGRTPAVYVFNPGAEAAAAASQNIPLDSSTRQLTEDLDTLSLFLARAEDIVLLRKPVRTEFLRHLKSLGIEIPAQEILCQGKLAPTSPLRQRKLARLRPWGWSADSHELLRDLMPNLSAEDRTTPWNSATRQLYSKSHAAELLSRLPWQEAFGSRDIIGNPQRSISQLWQQGQTALVKANFGIAGRRMLRFPPDSDLQGLDALASCPGGIIVEPWLERIADFSVHYEIGPDATAALKGFVRLHCEPSGRFTACVASGTFTRLLPAEVAKFLHQQGAHWLRQLYADTIPALLKSALTGTNFRGYLGIDAFFYREPSGHLRLKPIVEINPRCTMGRTTLELLRVAAPGRTVLLRVLSKQTAAKAGHASLQHAAAHLQQAHPIVLSDSPKIASGLFTLNDPVTSAHFLAIAIVANHTLSPTGVGAVCSDQA